MSIFSDPYESDITRLESELARVTAERDRLAAKVERVRDAARQLPAYPTEPYSNYWIRSWGLEANATREALLAALEDDHV